MDARAQQARAAYDTIVEPYTEAFFDELDRKPFDRELLDEFARAVRNGFVFDIGSGPGHLARYLRDAGVRAVALDISFAMLTTARHLTSGLGAVQASMTALPIRPGALAGIAAFYSVIHLEREALGPTFGEWREALSANGRVLVSFHGGTGNMHRTEMLERPVDLAFTMFEPDEVAEALAGAGFAVEAVTTRDPYEFESPTPRVYVRARRRASRDESA